VRYRPALPTACDYYPYGMLMPGRTLEAKGEQAVVSTQNIQTPIPYIVNVPLNQGGWILCHATATNNANGTVSFNNTASAFLPNACGSVLNHVGAARELTVTPGVPTTVYVDAGNSNIITEITEQVGTGRVTLTSATLGSSQVMALHFVPTGTVVRLGFRMPPCNYCQGLGGAGIWSISYERHTYAPTAMQLVKMTSTGADNYRFG
jgi:hypothetical protein